MKIKFDTVSDQGHMYILVSFHKTVNDIAHLAAIHK